MANRTEIEARMKRIKSIAILTMDLIELEEDEEFYGSLSRSEKGMLHKFMDEIIEERRNYVCVVCGHPAEAKAGPGLMPCSCSCPIASRKWVFVGK